MSNHSISFPFRPVNKYTMKIPQYSGLFSLILQRNNVRNVKFDGEMARKAACKLSQKDQ